MDKYCRTW